MYLKQGRMSSRKNEFKERVQKKYVDSAITQLKLRFQMLNDWPHLVSLILLDFLVITLGWELMVMKN